MLTIITNTTLRSLNPAHHKVEVGRAAGETFKISLRELNEKARDSFAIGQELMHWSIRRMV